jgi:hypothetical protein
MKGFYSWIYFLVIFSYTFSTSLQAPVNETNGSRPTTVPTTSHISQTRTIPSCIDKKVWNVCWLKTPPYIFDNPKNESIVEGILTEAITEGLQQCRCQVNLNFTLRVHEETELLNCSKNENIDLVIPFPHRGIMNKNWFFKVVDSNTIYLLLNRKKIETKAKENVLHEFSQVWTLAVMTILLAAIFGIIVWSLVSRFVIVFSTK